MENIGFRNPGASQGQSLIELALILPVLLVLVLGVVDYARAIQFNNILVAMSREGANLASRTSETPQNIIRALNNTAEPLVMDTRGRVYITRIVGIMVSGTVYPQVQAQTRSLTGATLPSHVWTCPNSFSVVDGSCNKPSAGWTNPTATLPMTLDDGEEVYAVETLYDYNVIVTYVMKTGPQLYSLTVL